MSELRIALLGCGFATRLHSRTLRKRDGVARFYASRDGARAEDYCRRYDGEGHFASYEAAFADPSIDVVLIATPPSSHLALTLTALDAGKHVIVEKPPYLRSADFTEVEARSARAGRRVLVAENYFYKPLIAKLREVIAAGTIGEVRILSVNALKEQRTDGWRDRPELAGGGALFEGGIHWVNFMANLGLTVTGVHGFRPGTDAGPEKTMVVVFEYLEGAVGTLYYSWEIGSPTKGLRLSSIYGSEGAITFESNGLVVGTRGRHRRLSMPRPRDLLGYGAMFDDFFDAIRTGRPARFELADARSDLELVERIYDSAASNTRSPHE
ncbi:MAG: Gfo/Idh/MocA family oxidoreductase [Gemmatimonadota bacterium]